MNTTNANRGFTLVELVVAMVVAAILVAIAVPSYTSYVIKARRNDARTALLGLAALEERYYSTANTYSASASDLGFASGAVWPQTVGSGYYTVSVASVAAATASAVATYTITATPVGTQAKDTDCTSLSINQTGTRAAIPNTDGRCWQ